MIWIYLKNDMFDELFFNEDHVVFIFLNLYFFNGNIYIFNEYIWFVCELQSLFTGF